MSVSPSLPAFNPLMPLHATQSRESAVICIPGAGASVTTFVGFTEALGSRWPIHGLQPRGLALTHPPHESVEAAAICNLQAIAPLNGSRRIHLMGHSHGGYVAFEMALRLQEQARPAASLTLIDSDPPDADGPAAPQRSVPSIFREFTEAFEGILDRSLDLDAALIEAGDERAFVAGLHAAVVKAKGLPARSSPDMLRGPLATFTAAVRCRYIPGRVLDAPVHLALVSQRGRPAEEDFSRQAAQAAAWRRHVRDLVVWRGPGHHFSILQAPHVRELADWWRACRDPESARDHGAPRPASESEDHRWT